MTDFTGKPVAVGDIVVFNRPYYKDLASSPVLKITPKGIKVKYKSYYSDKNECFIAEGQFVVIESVKGGLIKQTNFERIKAMTIEEMATFFAKAKADLKITDRRVVAYRGKDANENIEWLESEVQEE